MAIYEYECQKCGEILEVIQKMTDPPLKKHNGDSKCKGKLVKLMSANAFHLKGTGWYKTDYADKEKKAKEDAKNPKKDVKKETKAETKPDTKAEPKPDTKKEKTKEKPKAEKKKKKD